MTRTIAVAGDSNTAGPNLTYPTFDGNYAPATWGAYLTPAVQEVGGYARSGAKVADIYTNIPFDIEAERLVLFVGANDARDNTPVATFIAHIKNIVLKTHVGDVVAVGCPPRSDGVDRSNRAAELWRQTRDLSAALGWTFCDPWVDMKAPGYVWGSSGGVPWSTDGVHPTVAGYQHIAPIIEAAILA
jgi:lysophospholipase L1-like esterase